MEQKAGRGGRSSDEECLVLLIAEEWAFEDATLAKTEYETVPEVQRTDDIMLPLSQRRGH